MHSVNVSNWLKDEENSPYPEGARDKYVLISPAEPGDDKIIPNHRYLLKFSNKRYPTQFWSELLAYDIACHLGIEAPPTFYAEDSETGEPASLVEWFYGAEIENSKDVPKTLNANPEIELSDIPESAPSDYSLYVSGGNYMVRRIEGYDLRKGKQHNFTTIRQLIVVYRKKWGIDYWEHWVKVLLFDCIIGNTDRHQDNWGVLWRNDESGSLFPRFSPAFDNGTSLLHEIIESKLPKFLDNEQIEAYVRRGKHHMKWHFEDSRQMSHMEMVDKLIEIDGRSISIIRQCLDIDVDAIETTIFRYTEMGSKEPFRTARATAVSNVVMKRIAMLRSRVGLNG